LCWHEFCTTTVEWPLQSRAAISSNTVMGEQVMPRGDKSKYSSKQKRQAEHIEEGYEDRGVSEKEAERRAWATVNSMSGGGKEPGGSGRGKKTNNAAAKKGGKLGGAAAAARPAAARKKSAKKAAATRRRHAASPKKKAVKKKK
jgi:hypothetical protein